MAEGCIRDASFIFCLPLLLEFNENQLQERLLNKRWTALAASRPEELRHRAVQAHPAEQGSRKGKSIHEGPSPFIPNHCRAETLPFTGITNYQITQNEIKNLPCACISYSLFFHAHPRGVLPHLLHPRLSVLPTCPTLYIRGSITSSHPPSSLDNSF